MQLLLNLIFHLLLIEFFIPNSINENSESYFHSYWPLAHNDVTKRLRLIHYCLCMLHCFFATLAYLHVCHADVLSKFSTEPLLVLFAFSVFLAAQLCEK